MSSLDWPLGPTFARLCRAMGNSSPTVCGPLDLAQIPSKETPESRLLDSSLAYRDFNLLATRVDSLPLGSPLTPELGDSCNPNSSDKSSPEPGSSRTGSVTNLSTHAPLSIISVAGDIGSQTSLDPPRAERAWDRSRINTSVKEAHRYNQHLNDARSLTKQIRSQGLPKDTPTLIPISTYTPPLAPQNQALREDQTIDPDLDGFPIANARDRCVPMLKRPHPSDDRGPTKHSRRRLDSDNDVSMNSPEDRHAGCDATNTMNATENRIHQTRTFSLNAWLDNCINSDHPATTGPMTQSIATVSSKHAHSRLDSKREVWPICGQKMDVITNLTINQADGRQANHHYHQNSTNIGNSRDRVSSVGSGSTMSSGVDRQQFPRRSLGGSENTASNPHVHGSYPTRRHFEPYPKVSDQGRNTNLVKLSNRRPFGSKAGSDVCHVKDRSERPFQIPNNNPSITSTSRLRSEGFLGDGEMLSPPKPLRRPELHSQNNSSARADENVVWVKAPQSVLPAKVPNHERIPTERSALIPSALDPFPLDDYILEAIHNTIKTVWNRHMVEAFCRIGIWLENKGIWEHGNWGTLLSSELARIIDVGGPSRLSRLLIAHRPKPFEQILSELTSPGVFDLQQDGRMVRARLRKDFTPRGMFYR